MPSGATTTDTQRTRPFVAKAGLLRRADWTGSEKSDAYCDKACA